MAQAAWCGRTSARHDGTQYRYVMPREAGGTSSRCYKGSRGEKRALGQVEVHGRSFGSPGSRCHQLPHCAAHLMTHVFGVRGDIAVSVSPGYC